MDQEPTARPQTNAPAIAAVVLGVASLAVLLFLSIPIGLILAIAGLLLGGVGRTWAKTRNLGGYAMAMTGTVASFATIGLSLLFNVLRD